MAMTRTGWTDIGQIEYGEQEAPPTYYYGGAAHKGMQGHGCTRIDVILVNAIALATL